MNPLAGKHILDPEQTPMFVLQNILKRLLEQLQELIQGHIETVPGQNNEMDHVEPEKDVTFNIPSRRVDMEIREAR